MISKGPNSIREIFYWGSFGKCGTQPIKWRQLKDISDDHLSNILTHVCSLINHFGKTTLDIIIDEQKYRIKNKICIDDYE